MSRSEDDNKIRAGLKRALSTASDDLIDALIELGFNKNTLPVLSLIPLVYVAWADGTVSRSEAKCITDVAEERLKGDALELLKRLLQFRPDDAYLRRCLRAIVRIYGQLSPQEETRAKRDLLELAHEVAKASGGFLGLGDRVSDEEKQLIDDIAKGLRISKSERAAALHESLITRSLSIEDLQRFQRQKKS